ncbi:MAG: UMP kinase [Flavobacteriales bacterium]|jgi:uridylate kinase|nr:UMP kinase [Flavobacteriales bacterium]
MKYQRVLIKLSGESLMGEQKFGILPEMLTQYALEVKSAVKHGAQVAVVIGGGNIFRGLNAKGSDIHRVQGDQMGMLATVINALALQSALEANGVDTRVMTAVKMDQLAEPFIRRKAIRHLEKGRVVIFAGGTGNPFFTTDSAAALRASEIEANIILKGTRVDGIYSADPEKDPTATKYDQISFADVYDKNLNIMDMTAFTMCKENNIPIVVFDINNKGNLLNVLEGEKIGTLVSNQ